MKGKLMTLFACFLMVAGMVTAQNRTVSGVVTAAADGEPVIGASVAVKGVPTLGAVTDLNGKFTIANVPSTARTLVVSYVGMATKEVPIRANVAVALEEDSEVLEDVMVVAYGTTKKESFTGSAAVVSTKKIAERPVSNVTKTLDSQVAGITSTSGGGQPGDGAAIRVRGFGSISASSSPLYVVDGVPYDGNLAAINPNDIESMTVLKDASAGALYGARGANGVVIITTKRGAEKSAVNLKASWGFANRAIKRYNTVDQAEYAELMFEALRNGYVFNGGYSWDEAAALSRNSLAGELGGEIYNPFKKYTWATLIGEDGKVQKDAVSAYDENWMDALEQKNALRQEYQVSVTGGSKNTKTLLSLGYLDENGVLKTTNFQRYSGRLNVDNEATTWLKTGLNASFSHTNQNYMMYDGSSLSNVWYTAQFLAPIYPVYVKDANGKDVLDEQGNQQLDYGVTRPQMSNFNCIGTLIDDKSYNKRDNFSGRTYFTLGSDDASAGVLRGLKFTTNFGVDFVNRNQMYYYNMYHGNFASYGGILEKLNYRTFSYTLNELLTYTRSFGDHNFDVLAGHEFYSMKYNTLWGEKSGLVDGIYEMDPATTVQGVGSSEDNYRIESWLSRFNYNYMEKYYLSLSYRTDGSSRFNRDFRWGDFWSVGVNWRISQENFMREVDWVNNLALRASYGSQGNDDLGTYYAWQSFYDMTWPNASNSGARITSLENTELSWEKNANFNIGFDAALFNRLNISLEYYNKQTTDLLLSKPMALSTGFSGYDANVGQVENKGFEFTVGAQIVDQKNFKFRATVLGAMLKNKVLKLTDEAPEIVNGNRTIKVGYEINTFRLAKNAGVDPATGKRLYWVYEDGAYFNPGDDNTPWIDEVTTDEEGNEVKTTRESKVFLTDDYAVASSHRWYMGSRIPKLNGAVNLEFEFFKNFDLSISTAYSLGGHIYESNYSGLMNIQYAGNNFSKDALRRWQKPGDVTDVPRIELNGAFCANDAYLIDASYASIKNVTFGYTLPGRVAKKAGLDHARVFVTGDNLYLFSHLDGMDPQYNFSGGVDYTYTPNKTVAFGIDITFADNHKNNAVAPIVYAAPAADVEPEIRYVEKVVEKEVIKEVPVQAKKNAVNVDENLYFVIGKSELRAGEAFKLGQLCQILKDNPDATISIAGYADKGTGTTEINNQLSAARAKVVADKLIEAGISASRISTSAAIADDRVAVCIVK
ncbi:MAG: SusC/RagA family TonB-linked outer membrane protein [Bacteroidaceae bacterium]|nr:SusC/RagA family TonB-linked outer membrane protein [Bacteroidaceae bacterium]